jgi:hypothetical protein
MRSTALYPPLYRQTRTPEDFNTRLTSESSTINSSALTLEGGGGAAPELTVEELQTLSEDIIANDVPQNLSTLTVLKEYSVPNGMKGKAGFLTGYFYLKNQIPWTSNMTMNYGFALDNTPLGTINTRLPLYRHIVVPTVPTDTIVLSPPGSSILGRGGFAQRVTVPLVVPSDASAFSAVVTNSSIPLATTQVGAVATTTFTYTGNLITYTVPANVTNLTVHLWGAGGRPANGVNGPGVIPGVTGSPTEQGGGAAGYTTGTLVVTPGQTLFIIVGGTGQTTFVRGNAGTGGPNGGGFTAIFSENPSTMSVEQAAAVLLCLAGGGGGAGSTTSTSYGGSGGGLQGLGSPGGGGGGTQTAGGGGGIAGTLLKGGLGTSNGGGGGGGYYGGGGGGSGANNLPRIGGGGGSGFTGSLIGGTTTAAANPTSWSSWVQPPQFNLMQSFFGLNAYHGGSYMNGALAIVTDGIYPTFIGSEVSVVY